MLFSSWVFIAGFLPVTWLVFRALQLRRMGEVALLWLIAASLFFYGWFKPLYVLIILASMTFNFGLGTLLAEKKRGKQKRKALLAIGIGANLGALAYFKYAGFFFETLNALGADFTVPHVLLPLAISFFTFLQIAYLVDAFRGETTELNFPHYVLFVTFFPHLIAGPLVHHKALMPQFTKRLGKIVARKDLAMGLTVFIIGLFKKVAIADYMGEIADPVFSAAAMGTSLTFFEAWAGVLSYTMQIYYDFSGYSDMAVGLSLLFGIRMPINFFSPYKSASIIEFWRRWHISLSRFLRDYLYIPLGGSRGGKIRRYVNLMITMLLGGLWHGANWTFAIWGGLHGAYLVLNHAWRKLSPVRLPKPLGVAVTFIAVALAWVFFRADNAATALHVLDCLGGKYGVTLRDGDGLLAKGLRAIGIGVETSNSRLMRINEKWYVLWAAMAITFFAPSVHEIMKKKAALDITGVAEDAAPVHRLAWKPSLPWAVATGMMAVISMLLLTRVNAFIYFRF